MKYKFMRYSLFSMVLVFFLMLGCNQDDFQNNSANGENNRRASVTKITGDKAKAVAERLKNITDGFGNFRASSDNGVSYRTAGSGTIKYDEILEVVDTLGNTNYTFMVEGHPLEDEKTFYNVVVNNKENDTKVFLIKYEMEEAFASEYNNGQKELYEFRGSMTTSSMNSGDPCDEITTPVRPNPGSGSGGGGSSSDAGNGIGDTGPGNGWGMPGIPIGGQQPINPTLTDPCAGLICDEDEEKEDCECIPSVSISPRYFRLANGDIVTTLGMSEMEDPCNPNGTIAMLNSHFNNCQKLKTMISEGEQTKNNLETLKGRTNQAKEWGFALKYVTVNGTPKYVGGTVVESSSQNPNVLNMGNYTGGDYVGAFHTHPNPSQTETVPMFAPADVLSLHSFQKKHNINESEKDYSVYVLTLTVPSGTYAIKIEDSNKFKNLTTKQYLKFEDELIEAYRKSREQVSSNPAPANVLQRDFLKILKENDIGIGLYKASDDLNEWSKLELDPSNPDRTPITKPCN